VIKDEKVVAAQFHAATGRREAVRLAAPSPYQHAVEKAIA
jgi:hypothetical protein